MSSHLSNANGPPRLRDGPAREGPIAPQALPNKVPHASLRAPKSAGPQEAGHIAPPPPRRRARPRFPRDGSEAIKLIPRRIQESPSPTIPHERDPPKIRQHPSNTKETSDALSCPSANHVQGSGHAESNSWLIGIGCKERVPLIVNRPLHPRECLHRRDRNLAAAGGLPAPGREKKTHRIPMVGCRWWMTYKNPVGSQATPPSLMTIAKLGGWGGRTRRRPPRRRLGRRRR